MIEENFLQRAVNIRRTYLKLINNMDLYRARAIQVSERLDGTLKKIDDYQKELKESSKNKKAIEIYEQMLQNSKLLASKDGLEKYYMLSEDCLQKINLFYKHLFSSSFLVPGTDEEKEG